jgi:hypothetical protein
MAACELPRPLSGLQAYENSLNLGVDDEACPKHTREPSSLRAVLEIEVSGDHRQAGIRVSCLETENLPVGERSSSSCSIHSSSHRT